MLTVIDDDEDDYDRFNMMMRLTISVIMMMMITEAEVKKRQQWKWRKWCYRYIVNWSNHDTFTPITSFRYKTHLTFQILESDGPLNPEVVQSNAYDINNHLDAWTTASPTTADYGLAFIIKVDICVISIQFNFQGGHLPKADCWLSVEEQRKGRQHGIPWLLGNQEVPCIRVSERERPLGDLGRGWTRGL